MLYVGLCATTAAHVAVSEFLSFPTTQRTVRQIRSIIMPSRVVSIKLKSGPSVFLSQRRERPAQCSLAHRSWPESHSKEDSTACVQSSFYLRLFQATLLAVQRRGAKMHRCARESHAWSCW